MATNDSIPVIDVRILLQTPNANWASCDACLDRCKSIVDASINYGFFYVVGHSMDIRPMMESAKKFFELSAVEKAKIRMELAGHSWRGWFGVGDEFTSGKIDQKEGIYFGTEDPAADQRPLRGPNQWPSRVPQLKNQVLAHMQQSRELGATLMSAIATGLGLHTEHFKSDFIEPTELFRIFAYPPHNAKHGADTFAVGEHTDYGFLTILAQDASGGLQIRTQDNKWKDAPPIENAFVINLGDALENCTGGLLRATPHRVNQRLGATATRFSFPYFYDPGMDAQMISLINQMKPEYQEAAAIALKKQNSRWDNTDPTRFHGTYGTYLMKKISQVFPDLAETNLQSQGGSQK